MAEKDKPWILRASTRTHFRAMPLKRLRVLLTAVFLLFSVIGFYVDLNWLKGEMPHAVVVAIAVSSGLHAVLWIVVLSRLSRLCAVHRLPAGSGRQRVLRSGRESSNPALARCRAALVAQTNRRFLLVCCLCRTLMAKCSRPPREIWW
jgi:hypothetical protein